MDLVVNGVEQNELQDIGVVKTEALLLGLGHVQGAH